MAACRSLRTCAKQKGTEAVDETGTPIQSRMSEYGVVDDQTEDVRVALSFQR